MGIIRDDDDPDFVTKLLFALAVICFALYLLAFDFG